MRRMKDFRLGIGAKLGLFIGVGIVLIAALITSEHFSSREFSRLVAAADDQQTIVVQSLIIEGLLRRAQIAGRDLRKANTSERIDESSVELDEVANQLRTRMSVLEQRSSTELADHNFNTVRERTLSYVNALRRIGAEQRNILELFGKLDASEAYWLRSYNHIRCQRRVPRRTHRDMALFRSSRIQPGCPYHDWS